MVRELTASLAGNAAPLRIKKRTISNLFRYEGRQSGDARVVDLGAFDRPLHVDLEAETLEVQGAATYESVVEFLQGSGLVPTVTPELKHITVGGAIVGIGIETTSFRYGFVHEALLETEVLLADGSVVTCSPENEHADLFHALPNSYGTLGYILRASLRLRRAAPYVHLGVERFSSSAGLLAAMRSAASDPAVDYVESLAYAPDELYLVTGRDTDSPGPLSSIYGSNVFYRQISREGEMWLPLAEYLFRYDPEWFWALPESPLCRAYRRFAPRSLRCSSFYTHYLERSRSLGRLLHLHRRSTGLERLIQDWEVPWPEGEALLEHALANLDLDGRPWMMVPLRSDGRASGYPLPPGELYLNLGSYGMVKQLAGPSRFEATRMMDERCISLGGIKMLYSTSFFERARFDEIYAGAETAAVKARYDPGALLPSLYDKVVRAR